MEYRSEIDGLRAVAVVAVVLFHCEFGVPGGFVGVDVFFVISGYLISRILMAEFARTTARECLTSFWSRRIRRLLPASMLMTAATIIVGYFVLLPCDYMDLAEAARAQVLMYANVHHWHETGYFERDASLKPLLHTWSLAVEEQFYLVFPFWVLFLTRLPRRYAIALTVGVCSISFGLCTYASYRHPSAAFYLLPARAWEMLLGSLFAFFNAPTTTHSRIRGAAGLAGMGLISLSCFCFDESTRFPGIMTLVPCFGTILVLFNSDLDSLVNRVLSSRAFVFVGKISYSLYLWHWPVLAFENYVFLNQTAFSRSISLVLITCCALTSYYLVEQPIRTGKVSDWRFFGVTAFATTVLISVTTGILKFDGLSHRMPEDTAIANFDAEYTGGKFQASLQDLQLSKPPRLGTQLKARPSFAVYGDSHARTICDFVDLVASENGISGVAITHSGFPPLPGVGYGDRPIKEWNAAAEAFLIENDSIKNILMVARWGPYSTVIDPGLLRQSLARFVNKMSACGKQVYILRQVPEVGETEVALRVVMWRWFPKLNAAPVQSVTQAEYYEQQKIENEILSAADSSAELIDVGPCFFALSDTAPLYMERAIYRDNNHLTNKFGVECMLGDVLRDTIAKFNFPRNREVSEPKKITRVAMP